jgi:Leucine Rich Repeat (LRR) protein
LEVNLQVCYFSVTLHHLLPPYNITMDVRRLVFTPAWLVYAALVAEAILMLSAMFGWPPFNEHKGWATLTCTAIVLVAMLLIALGFVATRMLRWRFQFSLRSLLVLVLVVAIACGWLASEMARARRQADLVVEASKVGCGILYDYNVSNSGEVVMVSGAIPGSTPLNKLLGDDFFREVAGASARSDSALQLLEDQTSIRRLYLNDSQVTDAGLKSLVRLKHLEWIDLRDAPGVTDAGLKHLRGLTRLQELLLRRTGVADTGMVYLKDLRELRVLDLGMTQVTDVGLQNLAELTRLRQLLFWGNKIEDDGLSAIERMTDLEVLDLGFAPVTDAGLEKLKNLSQLRSLGLRGSQVTDVGLRRIAELQQLRTLDLYKTQISDEGLVHLSRLHRLETLHIGETRVSAEGTKKLQQALPECKIQ